MPLLSGADIPVCPSCKPILKLPYDEKSHPMWTPRTSLHPRMMMYCRWQAGRTSILDGAFCRGAGAVCILYVGAPTPKGAQGGAERRQSCRAALGPRALPPSPERASPRAAPMVPPFQGFDRQCGLLTQGGVPRLCRVTLPWAIESGPFGASEVFPGVGGLGLGIQCGKTGSETALN